MNSQQLRLQLRVAARIVIGTGRKRVGFIALFAVPLLLVALGIQIFSTATSTSEQRARYSTGYAQAALNPAESALGRQVDVDKLMRAVRAPANALTTMLDTFEFPLRFNGVTTPVGYRETNWYTPATRGWEPVTAGRLPKEIGEVAITTKFAQDHQLTMGSTLLSRWSTRPARVVGLVRPTLAYNARMVFAAPGQSGAWLDNTHRPDAGLNRTWLVAGLDRSQLGQLSDQTGDSLIFTSRAEIAGSRSLIEQRPGLVGVPGLLIIAVGSAAAFAIRLRRLRRDFGLATAIGFSPQWMANACRLAGICAALLGGLIGVVLGTALGVALRPAVRSYFAKDISPLTIAWPTLILLVLLAALVTVAAVWLPARMVMNSTTRTRISAAPRADASMQTRGQVAVRCAVGAILSAVLIYYANNRSTLIALIGSAGLAISLLAALPVLFAAAAALTGRASAPVRVAVRSLAREPVRPTAAVATGLIAMTITVSTLIVLSSNVGNDRRSYVGSRHLGQAEVLLTHTPDSANLRQAIATALPHSQVAAGKDVTITTMAATDRLSTPGLLIAPIGPSESAQGQPGSIVAIDTKVEFAAQTSRPPSQREWADLQAGRVLVLDDQYQASRNALVLVPNANPDIAPTERRLRNVSRSDAVDAVTRLRAGAFMSSATARRLGAAVVVKTLIITPATPAASSTSGTLAHTLEPFGVPETDLRVEIGPSFPSPLMQYLLLSLSAFAVLVCTTLALVTSTQEMRPDLRRLGELGFGRGARTKVVATQALLITVLSLLIGALLGYVMAGSRYWSVGADVFIDWAKLGITFAGVVLITVLTVPLLVPSTRALRRSRAV